MQVKKFERFKALHDGPGAFVMPNPWDAGSARILTALGFAALATTSAGFAFSVGRRDSAGELTREALLENARAIVEATPLPVSADLENAFADTPEGVAETMLMARDIGLAGASVEDSTPDPGEPIYGSMKAAVAHFTT
jgi:2-methylisocitrate lyase-like PEP mutase family enzyme